MYLNRNSILLLAALAASVLPLSLRAATETVDGIMKRALLTLLVSLSVMTAVAEEITPEQAKRAVATWTSRASRKTFGEVRGVSQLTEETSGAKFHVVKLEGGGYVVTASDNRVSPVVAYSDTDDFPTDPDNPFVQILKHDAMAIQQELEKASSNIVVKAGRNTLRASASAASSASSVLDDEFSAARNEWAELLGDGDSNEQTSPMKTRLLSATTLKTVPDDSQINVYVSAILGTKWGQTTHDGSSKGLPCYNYYAPKVEDVYDDKPWWQIWDSTILETNETTRVPCGCVATAAAQLMYKWKYPKKFDYPIKARNPKKHCSEDIRKAIGRLTYAVCDECGAKWGRKGTSMSTEIMVGKLRTAFGYSSSSFVDILNNPSYVLGNTFELSDFNTLVVPNLIAGYPVILSIKTDSDEGHCVVVDGLDMSGLVCKLHINLGWNGSANNWYIPPSVKTSKYHFTSVKGVGVNIMPHDSGAIIAGIILDDENMPISGAKVSIGSKVDYSDSHGRYSFVVPSGTYTIVAEKDTISNTAQATVKYSTGSDIKNAFVPIHLTTKERTSAPTITHSFDSFGQAVITMKADSGAVITYTTDGSQPTDDTLESIAYSGPFTINGAGFRLIRARAFREGFADSYTTDYRIPFPTSSNNGTFSSSKCITTSAGATLLNNISAGRESGEPAHSAVGNAGGSSVWASFVAPDDADYTFTAKGSDSASGAKGSETEEETVLDTQLAVYTGDKLSNLSLVAANDDVDAAEFDFSSRVAFHAVKGRTYHIAIDTQYGEKGIIQLEWTEGREDVAAPVDYDVFYDGEEQSRSIQIRSTADWFVADCSDWIVLTKSSGADGESVVFTTPALANDTYRTGTILVQAGEGAYSTIRVTQSPAKWYTNKSEAFEAAEALGKRVFMVCGRDSCPNTTYVRLTACESDSVKPILASDYVLWYCDCDKQVSDYADYELGLGGYTLPLVCIINPETPDTYVARRTGFATPAQLLEFLEENSEGLLPSLPIGVAASSSSNPAGITICWRKARRAQSYEIWRGDRWNPDLAECIGETSSDTEFLDELATPGVLYYYRVKAVNAVGAGDYSAVATGCYREYSDTTDAAIGNALGAPHLDWMTEGDYPWTVQGTNTYDGAGAMQSAFVDPKQSGVTSVLKTTVTGPTRMSFRYKTRMYSSRFAVKVDDVEAFLVTGAVGDWTLAEVEIPEGGHEVAFSYTKSGYYTSGFNGVYLDTVQFDVLSVPPTLTPATTDDEYTALSFTGSMTVSIAAPEGSDIFYTTDGSEPTRLSSRYVSPFPIDVSTRVRAMCVQNGYDDSVAVSGLYLERHPVQAGEWTTDVEGAKKAALKDGSIIVTLLGSYETCGYTRAFAAVAESAEFLSWARANGVYLITADSSRWVDANAAYNRFWDLFYDAGQGGSAYYPSLAIANAWDPDVATGYAVARSGQSIGSVQYDGTVATLEAGLASFFATRPPVSFIWVEFDGNGGTPYEKSMVGIAGQAIGNLPRASRNYHYFDGWYTSAAGGVKVTAETVLGADTVCFAHWTPYSYRVQFDANGGTVSTSYKYVSYGMAYGDLPIPTRTDSSNIYAFDGWYTAANGGTKVTSATEVSITSAQTLYAHWTSTPRETYVITYDPGVNGAGAPQTATKAQGVSLTLKGAIFTRTGYTQTGWATADGGARTFNLSSTYAVDSPMTLYPFWTAKTYVVTLNRQNGSGGTASVTATYGSAMPAISAPTRTGYKFGGYWTAASGGGTQYYTAAGASARTWDKTAATTLYAKWTANRAPVFEAVSPTVDFEAVELGVTEDFSVTTSDPDGDSVTVKWYVVQEADQNRRLAGSGNEFTFTAETAGNFRIEAVASDGSSDATCQWDVKVLPAGVGDYGELPGSGLVWSVAGTTLTISGNGPMPDYANMNPPYQGYAGTITAIVVEEGVTQVGDNAFQGFEGVTTVSLPETLTSIGIGAFADCASLDNVVIPDSVETLGEGAFSGCDSLGMLYLPQRFVPYIDDLDIPDTCSVTNTDVYRFVRRLYNLCLNREPEWSGCATWSKRLTSGEKDGAMAAFGFCLSAEMERRNLSNAEYVEVLYGAIMGRAPDTNGKAYWINLLDNGVSRRGVFRGFAESAEFTRICNDYGIVRGNVDPARLEERDKNRGVTMFVARCYTKALNRNYDVKGLNSWCAKINSSSTKKATAIQVAKSFLNSNEFKRRNLSNSAYVDVLYRTFFDRNPDTNGKKKWLGQLDSGVSRDTVMASFYNSNEFATIMAGYGIR